MRKAVWSSLLMLCCAAAVATVAHVQVSAQSETKTYVLNAAKWRAAQTAAVQMAGGTVTFSHEASGLAVATSDNPTFLTAALRGGAIAQAAEDMMVEWVKPAETVEATAITPGDETYANIQWNIYAVDAPGAWSAGCTGSGVRVAILDGGIDNTHADIGPNLDSGASRSFVPNQAYNTDTGTFWHGSHVAGIVAAPDNGFGTVGIAPEATLVGVKVLHNGSGYFSWVIQGILYAATPAGEGGAGADIINMSLGATFSKQGVPHEGSAGPLIAALAKAVNFADRHGVLVVVAAGNEGFNLDNSGPITSLPAQSGSGIGVSGTGPLGFGLGATDFRRPASYSNYGNSVVAVAGPGGDFALPGNDVCSYTTASGAVRYQYCWVLDMVISPTTSVGGGVYRFSWAAGTSMAAPAVAAVAALAVQSHPGISLGELKTLLARTADDEGKTGNDPFYGKGFANARRACIE